MLSKNMITYHKPRSPISEAYKMLRTNLHFLNIDKENKVILVTSAKTNEGKTTTICNLALSIAQTGQKVLLMECDLRKPNIHNELDLYNDKGLMNIIVGNVPVKEVIKICCEISNLDIILSGPIPPDPAELLESETIKKAICQLRENYDIVLIDAPPVCSVTDATILSRLVDGVILVTASGETNIEAAKLSKKLLDKANANILGTVLTKVETSKVGSYYHYYYQYSESHKKSKFRKFMKKKNSA